MKAIQTWAYGAIATIISGGAASVTSTFTGMVVAPQTFNLLSDWNVNQCLKMAGANFLVGGLIGLSNYLKQSPLPSEPKP